MHFSPAASVSLPFRPVAPPETRLPLASRFLPRSPRPIPPRGTRERRTPLVLLLAGDIAIACEASTSASGTSPVGMPTDTLGCGIRTVVAPSGVLCCCCCFPVGSTLLLSWGWIAAGDAVGGSLMLGSTSVAGVPEGGASPDKS